MIALARSEVLKIRTTRGWWAYLIVIVLLTGIAVAGDTGTAVDADRSQLEFQLGLVEAAGFAALLALILGITIVTTEFRHGTVTPTFLAAPRREQVLGSKTIDRSSQFSSACWRCSWSQPSGCRGSRSSGPTSMSATER